MATQTTHRVTEMTNTTSLNSALIDIARTADQIADRKYALACIINDKKARQARADRTYADARINANVNRHFSGSK